LKHMRWDPKDGDLFLNRAKTEETSLEARSGTDVRIVRRIWVKGRVRAENITGLKVSTEDTGFARSGRGVFSGRYTLDRKNQYRTREELMQA